MTEATTPGERPIEVFISHIALEQPLADALKKCVDGAFDGRVRAHAGNGVGPADIGDWTRRLQRRLMKSKLMLVLASPLSVKSPWVFFETGFASARGVRVIPICMPGQSPGKLPIPLVALDALNLSDEKCGSRLIRVIREKLELPSKRGFRYKTLNRGLEKGLEDWRFKIRLLIAIHERHRSQCTPAKLAKAVHSSVSRTEQAISDLVVADYLEYSSLGAVAFQGLSLSERGRELLARADLLHRSPQPAAEQPADEPETPPAGDVGPRSGGSGGLKAA